MSSLRKKIKRLGGNSSVSNTQLEPVHPVPEWRAHRRSQTIFVGEKSDGSFEEVGSHPRLGGSNDQGGRAPNIPGLPEKWMWRLLKRTGHFQSG